MRKPKALQNCRKFMDSLAADNAQDPRVLKARTKWYDVRNETADETEIFIYEEIGFWGITSDDFVRDLNNLKAKTIKLRINSPGGSVWDAIAIHSALVAHSATVTVQVDALAASAASLIAMAGDNIVMMRGAQMMIHDASGIGMGNEAELTEYAKWLGEQSNNIADIYAARSPGLTAEEWRGKMRDETWLFADEAVELGLADSVYVKPKQADDPEETEEEPEEESAEETEEEKKPDEEEEEEAKPEDRLRASHRLTNRGWKHAGRNRAPAPVNQRTGFADLLNHWR